jgi:hypothetical protein
MGGLTLRPLFVLENRPRYALRRLRGLCKENGSVVAVYARFRNSICVLKLAMMTASFENSSVSNRVPCQQQSRCVSLPSQCFVNMLVHRRYQTDGNICLKNMRRLRRSMNCCLHASFEVFTAVTVKNLVIWNVTPRGSAACFSC